MRRPSRARLIEAKQTIPHFYLTADIDDGRAIEGARRGQRRAPRKKTASRSTKSRSTTSSSRRWRWRLKRVPAANAVWARRPHPALQALRHRRRGRARRRPAHAGDPQRRGEIADRDLERDAVARRRAHATRSSSPTNIRAASAPFPISACTACANSRPSSTRRNATILAVGAAQRRPVEAEDGGVRFVSQMTVTLSCDHRVVDGALGAQLLAAFKALARTAGDHAGVAGLVQAAEKRPGGAMAWRRVKNSAFKHALQRAVRIRASSTPYARARNPDAGKSPMLFSPARQPVEQARYYCIVKASAGPVSRGGSKHENAFSGGECICARSSCALVLGLARWLMRSRRRKRI